MLENRVPAPRDECAHIREQCTVQAMMLYSAHLHYPTHTSSAYHYKQLLQLPYDWRCKPVVHLGVNVHVACCTLGSECPHEFCQHVV